MIMYTSVTSDPVQSRKSPPPPPPARGGGGGGGGGWTYFVLMFCVDLKFGSWISRFPQVCFTKIGCLFWVNSFGWVVVPAGCHGWNHHVCALNLLEECAGIVCSRLLGMWEIGWLIGPGVLQWQFWGFGFLCRLMQVVQFMSCGNWGVGVAVYCRGFFFSCGFFVEEEEDHACDIWLHDLDEMLSPRL
jgi:hypothetical protein